MKLKEIFIVVILSTFIFGCSDSESTETNNQSPVIINNPDPPEPGENPAEFWTYDGNSVKKFDGDSYATIFSGECEYAGNNRISEGDILYTVNEYGQVLSSIQLIEEPDFIVIDGDDTWITVNIPPADAQAAGAMYKNYTKIYKNNVEYGNWFTREYMSFDFFKTISGHIFCKNSVGALFLINDSLDDIKLALPNGILIHDFDVDLHTGDILTDLNSSVSWTTNYFNAANYWLESGDVWYSQNGYEFIGGILKEFNNTMQTWRDRNDYIITLPFGEAATVISAGIREENSETVLYWIECNSGTLMRYIPSIDRLEEVADLYAGDGYRTTGSMYKNALNPVIVGDYLYFVNNGMMYRYSFIDTNVLLFYAGWMRIWK